MENRIYSSLFSNKFLRGYIYGVFFFFFFFIVIWMLQAWLSSFCVWFQNLCLHICPRGSYNLSWVFWGTGGGLKKGMSCYRVYSLIVFLIVVNHVAGIKEMKESILSGIGETSQAFQWTVDVKYQRILQFTSLEKNYMKVTRNWGEKRKIIL